MFQYLPWKFIVQRAARAYGLADPALWLARIRSFAQPSEVAEPIELLRAGILFHARGLINTKAIQHNLDWIWPYWVQRQFDPEDVSFIPRAFSISHVNLTHRNWTALGLPGLALYPLVDPHGLITPLYDGWSLDVWLMDARGEILAPSRLKDEFVQQRLDVSEGLVVTTTAEQHGSTLTQSASVQLVDGQPVVNVQARAATPRGGALVLAIRPYNPEGIQFIDRIAAREGRDGWLVNNQAAVVTDRAAEHQLVSDYDSGDVSRLLGELKSRSHDSAAAAEKPNLG